MRYLLVLLSFLPLPLFAQLQFHYKLGIDAGFMAKTGPINTKGISFGHHQGLGVSLAPFSAIPLQLGVEAQYNNYGYRQEKAGQEFTYRMHYFNLPVYLAYPLKKGVSLEAGGYLASLITVRFDDGQQKIPVEENYRREDAGLLAGLNLFEDRRIGLYVRYQSSLRPAIVYPEITPAGEFTGTLRLLRPQLLMVGVRFNSNKHALKL